MKRRFTPKKQSFWGRYPKRPIFKYDSTSSDDDIPSPIDYSDKKVFIESCVTSVVSGSSEEVSKEGAETKFLVRTCAVTIPTRSSVASTTVTYSYSAPSVKISTIPFTNSVDIRAAATIVKNSTIATIKKRKIRTNLNL